MLTALLSSAIAEILFLGGGVGPRSDSCDGGSGDSESRGSEGSNRSSESVNSESLSVSASSCSAADENEDVGSDGSYRCERKATKTKRNERGR